jgi:hypothetical protein
MIQPRVAVKNTRSTALPVSSSRQGTEIDPITQAVADAGTVAVIVPNAPVAGDMVIVPDVALCNRSSPTVDPATPVSMNDERSRLVPDAAPITGVTSVGVVSRTKFPVPVRLVVVNAVPPPRARLVPVATPISGVTSVVVAAKTIVPSAVPGVVIFVTLNVTTIVGDVPPVSVGQFTYQYRCPPLASAHCPLVVLVRAAILVNGVATAASTSLVSIEQLSVAGPPVVWYIADKLTGTEPADVYSNVRPVAEKVVVPVPGVVRICACAMVASTRNATTVKNLAINFFILFSFF